MALLVIFDVPAKRPRRDLQRALNRLGFHRVFPNTYERHEEKPGPGAVEKEVIHVLRGEVYHLRIYSLKGRSTMRERWGK